MKQLILIPALLLLVSCADTQATRHYSGTGNLLDNYSPEYNDYTSQSYSNLGPDLGTNLLYGAGGFALGSMLNRGSSSGDTTRVYKNSTRVYNVIPNTKKSPSTSKKSSSSRSSSRGSSRK